MKCVNFFQNFEIKINTGAKIRSSNYIFFLKKKIKLTNNENDKFIT
jgi:hypothetical protein